MTNVLTYEDPNYSIKTKKITYVVNDKGCWECTSHWLDQDGYAHIWRFGRKISLHRYVYEQEIGKIPDGFFVMHKCDNPTCFNPEHLTVGTVLDNNRDKVSKGRQCLGESNGRSKLSEVDVIKIFLSNKSGPELAKEFGVSHPVIYAIKHGKRWVHVTSKIKRRNENETCR